MLIKALIYLLVFNLGFLGGAVALAVITVNRREEEREEAYKSGFKDCMHGRAPKFDVRK